MCKKQIRLLKLIVIKIIIKLITQIKDYTKIFNNNLKNKNDVYKEITFNYFID